MLPDLTERTTSEPNALKKEYSSADNVLGLEETAQLLEKHHLMVGQTAVTEGEELLR